MPEIGTFRDDFRRARYTVEHLHAAARWLERCVPFARAAEPVGMCGWVLSLRQVKLHRFQRLRVDDQPVDSIAPVGVVVPRAELHLRTARVPFGMVAAIRLGDDFIAAVFEIPPDDRHSVAASHHREVVTTVPGARASVVVPMRRAVNRTEFLVGCVVEAGAVTRRAFHVECVLAVQTQAGVGYTCFRIRREPDQVRSVRARGDQVPRGVARGFAPRDEQHALPVGCERRRFVMQVQARQGETGDLPDHHAGFRVGPVDALGTV